MSAQDLSLPLQQQIIDAVNNQRPLRIIGGNSKDFYGGACTAEDTLLTSAHCGVIDYQPSELVITARSGTSLAAINQLLAEQRQMLAFEPPHFGPGATLGGTIACGLSGPRRAFAGSARDFVLGCKIINGNGEILSFGGQVMKNVAGFDVSRLMTGALGTLGLLLEISLRVLPMPETELTLAYPLSTDSALQQMLTLAQKPWPLSAMAYDGQYLRIRLSGAETAVLAAARQLGGDIDGEGDQFWLQLREQQLGYFQHSGDLWRLSLAPAARLPALDPHCLIDWGGALRWLKTDTAAASIHDSIGACGGHALCFKSTGPNRSLRLAPALQAIQQQLRLAFDPQRIFNPGRLPF